MWLRWGRSSSCRAWRIWICWSTAGVSIWLDCPVEVVEQRIAADAAIRPLARDTDAFRRLYHQRRDAYSKAGYRIDADCGVDIAIDRILELPFWK